MEVFQERVKRLAPLNMVMSLKALQDAELSRPTEQL